MGSRPAKKLQGLPDESFIELVLGDWRVVNLGQLNWQAPTELVAALSKPFAIRDTIKTDPSQMEIQNAKRKNQTVPFINFLFRFADALGTSEPVAVLIAKYQQVVKAYASRPRTRQIYDVQSAALAGAFTRLP